MRVLAVKSSKATGFSEAGEVPIIQTFSYKRVVCNHLLPTDEPEGKKKMTIVC